MDSSWSRHSAAELSFLSPAVTDSFGSMSFILLDSLIGGLISRGVVNDGFDFLAGSTVDVFF